MARQNVVNMLSNLKETGQFENIKSMKDCWFETDRHRRTGQRCYSINTERWHVKFTETRILEIDLYQNYKIDHLYHWKLADQNPPIDIVEAIKILNSRNFYQLDQLMRSYEARFRPYIDLAERRRNEMAIFM